MQEHVRLYGQYGLCEVYVGFPCLFLGDDGPHLAPVGPLVWQSQRSVREGYQHCSHTARKS